MRIEYTRRVGKKMGGRKERGGLGFKNIKDFNLVMLAKQCWRMLKQPQSLVAKVIKNKYFKNGGLPSAKLGNELSLICRSLLSSIELVKACLIWKVGKGDQIKIWQDKWLPMPTLYKVQSLLKILDKEAIVSELIKHGFGKWKEDLIHETFTRDEAEMIISIPLSKVDTEDIVTWIHTINGRFSVKSAYHLDYTRSMQMTGDETS